jgi:hypothetical protein
MSRSFTEVIITIAARFRIAHPVALPSSGHQRYQKTTWVRLTRVEAEDDYGLLGLYIYCLYIYFSNFISFNPTVLLHSFYVN